jgi:hypothetical protein
LRRGLPAEVSERETVKREEGEPEDDHDPYGEGVVDDRIGEGIRFGDAEEA